MITTSRFDRLIERIDAANAEDPHTEEYNGASYPKELLYARRMTDRLKAFAPEASEELQIAARAQHICRWTIPRSEYPMTRTGYKQWRTSLMKFHAEKTGSLMEECGYDAETIARVQSLLQKKRLKKDEEAQTLEDVICLVFLEYYLPDFAGKHEEDKVIHILRKTWLKMSDRGHEAALRLPLPPESSELVSAAVSTN